MRKTVKMLVATAMVSGLLLGPLVPKGALVKRLPEKEAESTISAPGRAAPCGWAPGRSGT